MVRKKKDNVKDFFKATSEQLRKTPKRSYSIAEDENRKQGAFPRKHQGASPVAQRGKAP
jgi:hypothetical protein